MEIEMKKWSPMETAPKDGTVIVAFDRGTIARVRWYRPWFGFGRGYWKSVDERGSVLKTPTRWSNCGKT
jgi:hypothetical protein